MSELHDKFILFGQDVFFGVLFTTVFNFAREVGQAGYLEKLSQLSCVVGTSDTSLIHLHNWRHWELSVSFDRLSRLMLRLL